MHVSVVIPCYRSESTLGDVVSDVLAELAPSGVTAPPVEDFEVILVVDGSPDGTARVARDLAAAHPDRVRAVELRRNYGQHNALIAGIRRARHDVVVTMDDDRQHRADQIAALLGALTDDVDLVYGVAVEEEHGVLRSAASRLVKRTLAMAGVPRAEDVSAFRAFRTSLRDAFTHVTDPYSSLDVLLSWATTSITRVVVRMDERTIGTSSYTLRSLVRHALNMVTGYSNVPLRMVAWLGWFCAALGILLGAVVVWKFTTGETTVAGFTTIAAMVALFSGAQMLSLGVIGEYLGRLHTRSMGKPTYAVRRDSHVLESDARDDT
ncbi:glycosyltransferase family 2 protein [Cellulomonas hominis]|uniref:glycosyltransferase family 2 protein n=1 Tax=Cellulomonas hominis TaxID=156981 RepID=UPI001B8EAC32|nr:glycosyltransferase family 2 protein [Cellulomonas hominis]VTR76205.1 Undecaprenyl-phosphate 4-deoxy-4-formamido-L-arabinose transferase [Cellulomonas hominis]